MSIDWNSGQWQSGINSDSPRWRVTLAGDWTPLGPYGRKMIETPAGVYGDLLPIVQASDLAIVNMETVLTDRGRPIMKDGPNLRGDRRSVAALSAVPFHVACLSNNHILDLGPDAVQDTISVLEGAGLRTVGAGMNSQAAQQPLVLNVAGHSLTIINCGEAEESCSIDGRPGANGFDLERLERQVRSASQTTDVVLVVFHGGREYVPCPPPYVVNGLRRLANAGATAVIGHHPHAPQGIEIHNGVPIAYSLGNFIFHSDTDSYFWRSGYLIHLTFAGRELAGFELTPYIMTADGVAALKDKAKRVFLDDLSQVSAPLADPAKLLALWDAVIDQTGWDKWMDVMRESMNWIAKDKPKGAAVLRNRFWTPAHRELWLRMLERAMKGEDGTAPDWARHLVQRWQTLRWDAADPARRPGI